MSTAYTHTTAQNRNEIQSRYPDLVFLPDGIILEIDPEPATADPLQLSRNEEGYLYAFRIPAAHIIGPVR